jgi:hypothetical protein
LNRLPLRLKTPTEFQFKHLWAFLISGVNKKI